MRFIYDRETDSLYIELASRPGADAVEVAPGVVVDLDEEGRVVGLDLEHASERVDLSHLEVQGLPIRHLQLATP